MQEPLLSSGFTNKHISTETIELQQRRAVFSVQSVTRCYKRGKLGATVRQSVKRRVDGWCEMAANLGVIQLEQ
jgi:hypothetical protein